MSTEACDAPVCVLVIDRDEIARSGLVAWLTSDPQFQVVGDAAIGGEILAQRLKPDLIVVDPALDGELDVALIAALVNAAPDSYLCIYTAGYDPAPIVDLTLRGVDGYLLKRKTSSADVLRSLAALGRTGILQIDRHIVLDSRKSLVGKIYVATPDPAAPFLSEREIRVLKHVAQGLTRSKIATGEHMSRSTINRIVTDLFDKFRVNSATELVVRHG